MSTSYTDKFNVLEVFEQNPYQKIMMGAHIDNPDAVVVINIFKKGPHLPGDFLETAKGALSNVIHTESNDSEEILVTDYREGMSLNSYLESGDHAFDSRFALAQVFMDKSLSYENFNNYFKSIFLDDNQIIIQDDQLMMNELVIVDEQIESSPSFDHVLGKIAATLELVFKHGKGAGSDEKGTERADAFIHSLKDNKGVYTSLQDVVDAFRKAFIYEAEGDDSLAVPPVIPIIDTDSGEAQASGETPQDADAGAATPVNGKEIELEGLEVVDEIFSDKGDGKEKRKKGGPLAFILILLAAIIAFFMFANPFAEKEVKLPEASFVRQEIDGKLQFKNTSQAFGDDNAIVMSAWTVYAIIDDVEKQLKTSEEDNLELIIKNSGTYKVELKVQDKNENWSLPASEEFNYTVSGMGDLEEESNGEETAQPEKLEKYLIEYRSDNVLTDTELYRSGTQSIKMDLTQGDAEFALQDIKMEDNSIVSMWMLSDGTTPVTITLKGYNGSALVFTKTVTHVPRAANIWEMVEAKVNGQNVDSLYMTFSGQSTIWIDDIDISTFK